MTRVVGVGVFAAIVCAGLGLDRVNRRRTQSGPTFIQAFGWLRDRSGGRIAVFATWSYAGWHFFVR